LKYRYNYFYIKVLHGKKGSLHRLWVVGSEGDA
jgi:hypothetical protein